MKIVDIPKVTAIDRSIGNGVLLCPNCSHSQGDIDEFVAGTYECESCWRFYEVTDTLVNIFNFNSRGTNDKISRDEIQDIKKRLARIEKELGLK